MATSSVPTSLQTPTWTVPNDPLGAFCRSNHVSLQGANSGPLKGLMFAVKDCFHIAGVATGFGNPTWAQSQPVAKSTSVTVRRLLDAGGDMACKTHCDELKFDTLITASSLAPALRFDEADPQVPPNFPTQTMPFNVTGNPAMSIPTGLSKSGLPFSMQIVGRPFDEPMVLRIGAEVQRITGFTAKRPTLQ